MAEYGKKTANCHGPCVRAVLQLEGIRYTNQSSVVVQDWVDSGSSECGISCVVDSQTSSHWVGWSAAVHGPITPIQVQVLSANVAANDRPRKTSTIIMHYGLNADISLLPHTVEYIHSGHLQAG